MIIQLSSKNLEKDNNGLKNLSGKLNFAKNTLEEKWKLKKFYLMNLYNKVTIELKVLKLMKLLILITMKEKYIL